MSPEFHEMANIFPLLEGQEFDDLCKDIAINGLIEPIWKFHGKILDGRNRFRACEKVGIAPVYREFTGEDPLQFIMSLNVKRRHLDESQRAMVAARLETLEHGQRADLRRDANVHVLKRSEAAKMLNVSSRIVASAKQVLGNAPEEIIAKIDSGELSVSQYARRFSRQKKIQGILEGNKSLEGNGKKYSVIYADPPWKYDYSFSDSRAIEEHYPTMELEDICNLKVNELATNDAILFLWCPPAFNKKALKVMDAWCFDFRTNMIWVKPSIGPGQWVRQQHELLLIGVRGNIPTPEGSDRPSSVIKAERRKHSQKPEIVYDLIEKMYPTLERIELFARQQHPGWTAWGNQA